MRQALDQVLCGLFMMFAVLGSVGLPATANAGLFSFSFSGTVDLVDPALAGTFSVGQALTGSYTFESTTPPRAGSTANNAVFDALTDLDFEVGAYSASSSGAPEIQIDNDPGLPFHDRYAVVSRSSDGLAGPAVGGLALNFFGFRLDDSTDTVFSTALDLPTSLDLDDFDNRQFFIFFGPITAPAIVSGTITSLAAVPEPSSATLMGLGLVGVLGAALRTRVRKD